VIFGHRHNAGDGTCFRQVWLGGCRYQLRSPTGHYAVPVERFTFLFTDIEGSTALLGRVGQGVYARVLAEHHAIIRSGLSAHGGREVDTQGDAFFVVFSSPGACVAAVIQMQQALQAHGWPGGEQVRVRMGVHSGEASETATGLVGLDVHRAARVAAAGHGGQVLLSEASAALVAGALPPGDPADALASLLLTAGVPAGQIPAGLEARMALWRDRLAGQQLLLILDDAAGSEQVRPLLPGAGGSLVLVTSRRHLSALEDARAISLDTLPPGEAAGLLVRMAGRAGLHPDDPAVAELTRLCGFLPLAIGMVARQLHHHPAWTAAGRAAELAAAVDRLELMATENLSVAAAFNLSYQDLAGDQQRLFRRLGLHPGADIDAYAAAALDGTDLGAARRGLEALYDQYLIAEPAQGRFRLHDLIGEHARALADRLDPDRDRDGATTRLLDYYQHTAARAGALIARQSRPGPAPADGTRPRPRTWNRPWASTATSATGSARPAPSTTSGSCGG